MSLAWTPESFEADDGTVPFERFVNDELSDFKAVALITAIERVLAVRGIDLARTGEIEQARKLLAQFKERQRRQRKKEHPTRPNAPPARRRGH